MTGKKRAASPALSSAERARLEAQLADLQRRAAQWEKADVTGTYFHDRAAELAAILEGETSTSEGEQDEVMDDGKRD